MRFVTSALAVGVAAAVTYASVSPAAASTNEYVSQNVGDMRFVERTDDGVKTPSPDSVTVRVLGQPVDVVEDTPTGKQMEWGIADNDAPSIRSFEVEMDGPVHLELHEASGAIVVSSQNVPVALIESPWARDANGAEVPTYFTVEGKRFTQHVDTKAGDFSYPITADPRVNWGIVSGHAYFSKEETRKMAAGSAAATAISPFWLLVPPPAGEALGYWWTANALSITGWATAAVAQDKCLALKIGVTGTKVPPSVGVSPEHYTDGCV